MTVSTGSDMRAMVLHGPGDFRMETRPVPTPAAGEVLIRVGLVGICGSDIHYFETGRSGSSVVQNPVVLGHEFGGSIAAVGEGVRRRIGERVSVEPGIQCGRCAECLRGSYNHCEHMRFLGAAPTDGAMQEYVVVPSDHAFAVPDEVSDEAAALIEPLSVALWGLSRAGLKAGESVLIVGAGPIGVLCALVASTKGADHIVILDPIAERRERATAITGFPARARTDGDPMHLERFDVVLECSGSAPGLATATASVRRGGGRVVVVGVGVDRLEVPMQLIQEGEVTVTGSHRYRETWPDAIELIARGRIDVDALVTSHFALEQVQEAILSPQRTPGSLKVCIDVSGPVEEGTSSTGQSSRP